MEQNGLKKPRVEVVDALRGFAVMAILMVHSLEHFIFPVYPTETAGWLEALDAGVFNATFALFAGKAYAIFALLFGFTFYIQMNNQRKVGKDFGYRFLWRMVGLVFFATLNAAFFPAGDMLLLFSIVALVLFLTRHWSEKAVNAGRYFQTAGLFLLGYYLGRRQLFLTSEANTRFWTSVLCISAVAFAPLYVLKELIMGSGDAIVQQSAGTAFDMYQKLAFTGVLVSAFVLLYQGERFKRMVGGLRYYGKMSLTNYITQSIIGAIIYFPFGLYLAPHCGYTLSLLVGICTFLLQVQCCKWWLARHKQGPLEKAWHRWTWVGTEKS